MASLEHNQNGAATAAAAADGREGSTTSTSSSTTPSPTAIRLSRGLGRAIFYAALALIPLTSIPYGTVEAWSIALFEIIVFALGALWMAEGALLGKKSGGDGGGQGGFWLRREHALLLAPLALVTVYAYLQSVLPVGATPTGLTVVISADPYETRLFALHLLALTVFAALLLRYTTTRRRLAALVLTVLAVGILSAMFGILRQSVQRAGDTTGFLLPYLAGGSGYAQYIGRNSFAFLMEMSLGLGFGLLFGVPRERLLLVFAALLPLWTALVLCNSRGGVLSMLAEIVFAALLYLSLRSTPTSPLPSSPSSSPSSSASPWQRLLFGSVIVKGALIATLLIITLAGTLWMGGAPLADRLGTVSGEMSAETRDPSGASRRDIWRSTSNLVKAHPLTGSGFGAYWIAVSQYHEGSGALSPQQAHNDYLELAASGGLPGVVLFLSFIYLLVKRARAELRHNSAGGGGDGVDDRFRRAACTGALIGLFGVSVHSLGDFGLHVTANALVCLSLVAVATARIGEDDATAAAAPVSNPRRRHRSRPG